MPDLPPPVWLARELDPAPLADFPHLDGFGSARFRRRQSARPPHRHRGIEIHYVWRGQFHWTVEGRAYAACAGDAFVTCPWQLHGSPSGRQEPGAYSWAIITPRRFAPDADLRLGAWSWLPAAQEAAVGRQLAAASLLPAAQAVGEAMRRLAEEFAGHPPGWEARVDALLADLLLLVARAASSAHARGEDAVAAGLARDIRAEAARPWTLAELCRRAGCGPDALRRRLLAASGLGPRAFVAAQRVALAAERLRAGGDLVAIALDCGFASQQHLTTRFRQETGYTPGAYRAAWR